MPSPNTQNPAVIGCIEALERCQTIVRTIPDELFGQKSPGHETIGSHLRHAVEHVQCLLNGIQHGQIDYDERNRSTQLEEDKAFFQTTVSDLIHKLRQVTVSEENAPITLKQLPALNEEPMVLTTSIEREFVFASSHIIHHLAVVYFICKFNDIEFPNDLVLAFSTAAHRQAIAG
jgi:hypothetical protein